MTTSLSLQTAGTQALSDLCYQGTDPTLRPHHLPKASPSGTITLGFRLSTCGFGGGRDTHFQSVAVAPTWEIPWAILVHYLHEIPCRIGL